MAAYLLDTNIVSYYVRCNRPALTAKMALEMPRKQCYLSAITCAELRFGMTAMQPGSQRYIALERLMHMLRIIPWGEEAASEYGTLKAELHRQGRPIGELDTQIAAHALSENLTLVTHNTKHFEGIEGLTLADWTL